MKETKEDNITIKYEAHINEEKLDEGYELTMNYYNIINEEDKNKYKFLVTDTHIQTGAVTAIGTVASTMR